MELFIGGYGSRVKKNLHWMIYEPMNKQIKRTISFSGIENPSFLAINKTTNCLYVISEVERGEVVSYQMDVQTGQLAEINRMPTNGAPCYIEVNEKDNILLTANYGNGSIIAHDIRADGSIGDVLAFEKFQDQNGDISRIHTFKRIKQTNYYIAVDIGLSKLYVYQFNENRMFLKIHEQRLPKGSGPRDIVFHPNKNVFYIVNEYHNSILTYEYNTVMDDMRIVQIIPTIPVDFKGNNYGAAIVIDHAGETVYVSNRGHHSIVVCDVNDDGTLKRTDWMMLQGAWPRHFILDSSNQYLLIANEHSDEIDVIDIKTLHLQQLRGKVNPINRPACIKVM